MPCFNISPVLLIREVKQRELSHLPKLTQVRAQLEFEPSSWAAASVFLSGACHRDWQ